MLAFTYRFSFPLDNNLAERDLRMAIVPKKISGGLRSAEGVSLFCRIGGDISTLRKLGCNILSALESVFAWKPFLPSLKS